MVHTADEKLWGQISPSYLPRPFPNVFSQDKATDIKGFCVNLTLKPNVTPVFASPYSLPFSLQDVMSDMLDSLTAGNKLVKVDRSDWASPVFLVQKKMEPIALWLTLQSDYNKK